MASFEFVLERERQFIQARRNALRLPIDSPTWGLAYSGGGIRSAAFACGALLGLASRGDLHHIDYLSSVSGGGYTASSYVTRLLRALKERRSDPDRILRETAKSTFHEMRERAGYLVDRSTTASAAACGYATFAGVLLFTTVVNALVALSPLTVVAEAIASFDGVLFPADPNALRWSALHATLLWTTLGVLAIYAGLLVASAIKPAVYGVSYRLHRTIAISVFWLSMSLLASIVFTQTLLDHYHDDDSSTAHSVVACVGIAVLSMLSPLTAAGSRQTRLSSFLGAVSFASKLFFVSWWAAGQLFLVRSASHRSALTTSHESSTLQLLRSQTIRPICCFLALMLIGFQPISTVLYRYCRRGLSTFHAPYQNVPLSQLAAIHEVGGPYYLCNATLNNVVHERDGDFGPFHFSPLYSGSPLSYYDTAVTWPQLSTIEAVTISGAAVNSAMGRYVVDLPHSLRFFWNAFGWNMGCWVPRTSPSVLPLAAVHGCIAILLALCASAQPLALWVSIVGFVVLGLVALTSSGRWVLASAYFRMLLQSFGHAWVIAPDATAPRHVPVSPVSVSPVPVSPAAGATTAPAMPAPGIPPQPVLTALPRPVAASGVPSYSPSSAPDWLYLSDGGHYENMAVLELFRRGVSRIIVLDGSEDPFDTPGDVHPNAEVFACAEMKGAFQCAFVHGLISEQCKAEALYILDQFSRGTNRSCQIPLTYTHTDVDPAQLSASTFTNGSSGTGSGGRPAGAGSAGSSASASAGAHGGGPVLLYVKLRSLPQDKSTIDATNQRLVRCDKLFSFPRHSTAYQLFTPELFEAYAELGSSGVHDLPSPLTFSSSNGNNGSTFGVSQLRLASPLNAAVSPNANASHPPQPAAAASAPLSATPGAVSGSAPWTQIATNGLWAVWLLLFGVTRALSLARGPAWAVVFGTKAMRFVVGADVVVLFAVALRSTFVLWADGRSGICANARRKALSSTLIGGQTLALIAVAAWLNASIQSSNDGFALRFAQTALPCSVVSTAGLYLCGIVASAIDADVFRGVSLPVFVRAKYHGAIAWAVVLLPCSLLSAAGTAVSAPFLLALTVFACALYLNLQSHF